MYFYIKTPPNPARRKFIPSVNFCERPISHLDGNTVPGLSKKELAAELTVAWHSASQITDAGSVAVNKWCVRVASFFIVHIPPPPFHCLPFFFFFSVSLFPSWFPICSLFHRTFSEYFSTSKFLFSLFHLLHFYLCWILLFTLKRDLMEETCHNNVNWALVTSCLPRNHPQKAFTP